MRALRLLGPRSASIEDVPLPVPGAAEVLVKVRACGVCGSDLHAWRGVPGVEYPQPAGAPGHEIWGEIAETGQPVTGLAWNGFSAFTVAQEANLVPLSSPFDTTPLLGEPLACAVNVVRRAMLQPAEQLAVVGFGYLAALIVQLAPPGTRWTAISRRPDSRALAERLGAHAVYDFSDIPQGLWDSFPVVIEAAGVQQSLDFATWLTGYGGRLVIAGYHADGPRTVNMQSWNWKGIDVVNAHERDPSVYLTALRTGLRILSERQLDLASLLTHAYSLDEVGQAFAALEQRAPGFVKAIVRP